MNTNTSKKDLSLNVSNSENTLMALEDLLDQAIHDMQSPLDALKNLIADITLHLSEKEQKVLERSFDRLSGIMASLKNKEQFKNTSEQKTISSMDLLGIIDNLIYERILGTSFKGHIIFHKNIQNSFSLELNPLAFERAFVNLLNNAIEASEYNDQIVITIEAKNGDCVLSLKDFGHGISQACLEKIGNKGATFNKKNGNGFGLFQVKKFIEASHGRLEIISEENEGTLISMKLPLVNIGGASFFDYVLIDNDELVRLIWETKAQIQGVSLLALSGPEQLPQFFDRISKTKTQIYIDSDLDNLVRGEFVAKSLYESGYKNLYMATGHEGERFKNYHFLKRVGKNPAF